MTTDDLVRLGLNPLPHFTIMNSHVKYLGRNKFISVGNVGTPNEMVYLYEVHDYEPRKIMELINIHNYDYDGYLTEEKLVNLLKWLELKEK